MICKESREFLELSSPNNFPFLTASNALAHGVRFSRDRFNGAVPAKDLLLVSAGAELQLANNVAIGGSFEGDSPQHHPRGSLAARAPSATSVKLSPRIG